MDSVLVATGNDWRAVEAGVSRLCLPRGSISFAIHLAFEQSVLTGYLEALLWSAQWEE